MILPNIYPLQRPTTSMFILPFLPSYESTFIPRISLQGCFSDQLRAPQYPRVEAASPLILTPHGAREGERGR